MSDAQRVIDIMNQGIAEHCNAYLEPFTKEEGMQWFENMFHHSLLAVVAEVSGTVAAWGLLSPYRSGRGALAGCAEITFYVDQKHRSRGLGKALIQHLEEEAKLGMEVHHLIAILLGTNIPSRTLLASQGFDVWAEFKDIVRFQQGTASHLYMGKAINNR